MQKTKNKMKKKNPKPHKQNKTKQMQAAMYIRGDNVLYVELKICTVITASKTIKTPLNFAKINKNMHKKTGVKFWPKFSFKKEDSLWTLNQPTKVLKSKPIKIRCTKTCREYQSKILKFGKE